MTIKTSCVSSGRPVLTGVTHGLAAIGPGVSFDTSDTPRPLSRKKWQANRVGKGSAVVSLKVLTGLTKRPLMDMCSCSGQGEH